MFKAEQEPSRGSRPVRRIVIGIAIILLVGVATLSTFLPGVQRIIGNPGAVFAGDDVLQDASRSLANAEVRIARNPDDEEAHLNRAKAYLAFGHLEGALLEWDQNHGRGSSEWGDIRRSIDELRIKTDEIRALLHEAETSTTPSEKYPPIYTLLDDVATRFEGIPAYRAQFLKGYLLLREGRRAEAEPIFADELDHYVPLADYVGYNLARSLTVAGNEDNALEAFDKFLDEFPESRLAPLAYLERINILRDLERLEDAITECGRALDSYPSSDFAPKTLRKWAEIYEGEMDFGNGAQKRIQILRDFPDSDEASETMEMFFGGVYALNLLDESDRLVAAYAGIGYHTTNALDALNSLIESGSLSTEERAQAYHGIGRCEYIYDRYYDCIDSSDKAIASAPGTIWADRASIRKGHAYWALDKYDLALETYWGVARGHGELASLAAEILVEKAYTISDLDTVREGCRYIIDEYPSSDETPQAMALLAYLGIRDREYQSAKGYAERCLSAFPDDKAAAEAGFWLAHALKGLGRSAESNEAFTNLAERVPWNYWGIRARESIGQNSIDYGSLDPFDFDPSTASQYTGSLARAWELYDAGVLELAENEFREAHGNGQMGALMGLAITQMEAGKARNAIVNMREGSWVGEQANLTPERQDRILSELYPLEFEANVTAAALAHDIPPSWLWGAMRQESSFNPRAKSSADARGLIQIMPGTGRFIADKRGLATFDPETLYDPSLNIDYAAWYFDYLRDYVGGNHLLDILAAYNGGPGRWTRYRGELPTRDEDIFISAIPNWETRSYSRWVYANVRMYDMVLEKGGYNSAPF